MQSYRYGTLQPLVSVYIATRDRCGLLRRAIASVLGQTYRNVEVVVVDDGSMDGTAKVLANEAAQDRRVRYLVNSQSVGPPSARNVGINMAKGEFITGLDDDDEFLPERVQVFVDHYRDSLSFLSTCVVERGGDYMLQVRQPTRYIDRDLIRRKNFVGNQIFTRTERLREIGGFDEGMEAWQDYDLWLRMIDRFGPAMKLPVCTYLLDRSSSIGRITTSDKAKIGYEQFIERHGHSMSPGQLRHQRINDLHNRSVRIDISEFASLWSHDTAMRLIALVAKAYSPRFYRLVVAAHIRMHCALRRSSYRLADKSR